MYTFIHSGTFFSAIKAMVRKAFCNVSRKAFRNAFRRAFRKATLGAARTTGAAARGCGVLKPAFVKGSSERHCERHCERSFEIRCDILYIAYYMIYHNSTKYRYIWPHGGTKKKNKHKGSQKE